MTQQHKIEVVEYDPAWAERFALERNALRPTVEPWLAGPIEHVGSTAVPGLCAKPVIDIMIPVRSLSDSRPVVSLLEQRHGYIYWPNKVDFTHWLGKPSAYVRTHHVHLIPIDDKLFEEHIYFRDMLRRDPKLRSRYAELKLGLANEFPHDRQSYTEAKSPFIRSVLEARDSSA